MVNNNIHTSLYLIITWSHHSQCKLNIKKKTLFLKIDDYNQCPKLEYNTYVNTRDYVPY